MGKKEYIESYFGLCHGTTEEHAKTIVEEGFHPSTNGWCGCGIYFYDIRSKAKWSADRTCRDEFSKGMGKQQSAVVYADIVGLKKEDILDLRVPQSFVGFIEFANKFLSIGHIQNCPDVSDEENLINRRSILISAYSKAIEAKLVIGFFEQRERERIADEIRMAKGYNMVVGIETIYCVKDSTILSNVKQ